MNLQLMADNIASRLEWHMRKSGFEVVDSRPVKQFTVGAHSEDKRIPKDFAANASRALLRKIRAHRRFVVLQIPVTPSTEAVSASVFPVRGIKAYNIMTDSSPHRFDVGVA